MSWKKCPEETKKTKKSMKIPLHTGTVIDTVKAKQDEIQKEKEEERQRGKDFRDKMEGKSRRKGEPVKPLFIPDEKEKK